MGAGNQVTSSLTESPDSTMAPFNSTKDPGAERATGDKFNSRCRLMSGGASGSSQCIATPMVPAILELPRVPALKCCPLLTKKTTKGVVCVCLALGTVTQQTRPMTSKERGLVQ